MGSRGGVTVKAGARHCHPALTLSASSLASLDSLRSLLAPRQASKPGLPTGPRAPSLLLRHGTCFQKFPRGTLPLSVSPLRVSSKDVRVDRPGFNPDPGTCCVIVRLPALCDACKPETRRLLCLLSGDRPTSRRRPANVVNESSFWGHA